MPRLHASWLSISGRSRCVRAALLASMLVARAGASARAAHEPQPPYGVRGIVLDAARRPVRGAEIKLLLERASGARLADTTHTDDEGRFLARGSIASSADGMWRLEVSSAGYATSVVDELFGGFGIEEVGAVFVLEPASLSGRIVRHDGSPVAGAEIRIAPGEAKWSRFDFARAAPTTRSGIDGRFAVASAPPARVTLGISAAGCVDRVLPDLVLASNEDEHVDVVLERSRIVTGNVVDADGAPIQGAVVDLSGLAFWRAPVTTDARGEFGFDGLPPTWRGECSVAALGFVPVKKSGAALDVRRIELRGSAMLTIEVRRAGDGPRPSIEHVLITDATPPMMCGMAHHPAEIWFDPLVVDLQGPATWRVAFESAFQSTSGFKMPPKQLWVWLADGTRLNVPWPRDPQTPILLDAPPTGGLAGRVLRRSDRSPVAGTRVTTNLRSVLSPDLDAMTDAEGRFAFEGLAAGNFHDLTVDDGDVRGSLYGFEIASGRITKDIELLVDPKPRIVGRITIGGEPPREPIVVGLGEVQSDRIVEGGYFGVGVSDAAGNYSVVPKYDRRFTVVAKRRTTPVDSAYRRFRDEFPVTSDSRSALQAKVPRSGERRLDFDLPK